MFSVQEYQGIDGHTLRYGELRHTEKPITGKGLLFIPGLGGSVKGALGFLECLLPYFSPIYAPDLRSFGLNSPHESDSATTQAQEATPLLHARDLPLDLEAFHQQVLVPAQQAGEFNELALCGISLGGVMATLLAARHPERYNRLILLAPAYKPHPKSFSLRYVLHNILSFLFLGKKARTTLPYGPEALTRNVVVLEQMANNAQLVLSPGFLLSVRDLANIALQETRRLTIPTLVVVPGQDIICDPRTMREAYATIPESTPKYCLEYPDFYHDVLFETGHPEIAEATLAWIMGSSLFPNAATQLEDPVLK